MSNLLGVEELNKRFNEPELREILSGLFPSDNTNDVRFAINFYATIGLGHITYF